MPRRPTVYVCTGSDCAPHKSERAAVCAAVADHARCIEVRCQKVCKGQVVGTRVDGHLEWFKRVGSPRSVRALAKLVKDGRMRKPLARRRVKKRQDKLRR